MLGSCSGSTVGSNDSTAVGRGPSGTFARPPQGVASKLSDVFMPRRMEFKGWVTDKKQCRYQGLTDTEVLNVIDDLYKMVPDAQKKMMGIKQRTTKERGQSHVMREELKKGPYKQKDQVVSSRLEIKPEKEIVSEGPCFVLQRTRRGEREQVQDSRCLWQNSNSFFVGSAIAAKYTSKGEGLAREGWDMESDVIAGICTEFSEPLFETVVNSV